MVDAQGGPGELARRTGRHRVSRHKMFSPRGNPTLKNLEAVLEAAGLRLVIAGQERPKRACG